MKKEDRHIVPYDKNKLFYEAMDFLKTDKKLIIFRYEGKRLNSLNGFVRDGFEFRVPIGIWRRLLKYVIQGPIFIILSLINGGRIKNSLYKIFGAKIGKDVFIGRGVCIDEGLPELITIGDGSILGKDVTVLAHEFTIKHARFGRVKIGKQVVVGAKSIIRSGITIGDKSVIAMNSFVNKDIPSGELWGGTPARRIKKLKKLI
jgi:acetyltransferase-like isoleucine patch superfamily enzyme